MVRVDDKQLEMLGWALKPEMDTRYWDGVALSFCLLAWILQWVYLHLVSLCFPSGTILDYRYKDDIFAGNFP